MSCFQSWDNHFSWVYILGNPEKEPMAAAILHGALSKLPALPAARVKALSDIPKEHLNQRTLVITEDKGHMLKACPASKGRVCCNYLTLNVYGGCTLGCSYCIMKTYLNYKPITVAVNIKEGIDDLTRLARENPETIIRAGTGETGDSLLYDPLFDISRYFIEGLKDCNNVFFEMKTKTASVDHLLDIPRKGNAVVGFSLNPPSLIKDEEPGAADLEERLQAAEKAFAAGYHISFHFDPIIIGAGGGWEDVYFPTVRRLSRFPKGAIAWISMGLFRYPPSLKDAMEPRPYLSEEYLLSADGKLRIQQSRRVRVYGRMLSALWEVTDAPVYLCMENEAVWRKVFRGLPQGTPGLKPIYRRIRGVHWGRMIV